MDPVLGTFVPRSSLFCKYPACRSLRVSFCDVSRLAHQTRLVDPGSVPQYTTTQYGTVGIPNPAPVVGMVGMVGWLPGPCHPRHPRHLHHVHHLHHRQRQRSELKAWHLVLSLGDIRSLVSVWTASLSFYINLNCVLTLSLHLSFDFGAYQSCIGPIPLSGSYPPC